MSLEAALQEHTAVMRELLARLSPSATAVAMTGSEYVAQIDAEANTEAAAEVKLPTTAKEAVDAAKASAAKAESANKGKTVAAKVEADTEAAALDYEKDVRPLLVKVSLEKGRDALIALLNKFGATKGDQLAAGDLAGARTAANELLGA